MTRLARSWIEAFEPAHGTAHGVLVRLVVTGLRTYKEGTSSRGQRITMRTRRPRGDAVRVVEVTDALGGAVAGVAVGSLWEQGVAGCWRRMATD
jgi:hypothetical protein